MAATQRRFFSTFGAYDFFGKSIPGALALVLLSLTFPIPLSEIISNTANNNPEIPITFPVIFGAIVALIIVGFVTGQAIHTLAVLMEKVVYITGSYSKKQYDRFGGPGSETLRVDKRSLGGDEIDEERSLKWSIGRIIPLLGILTIDFVYNVSVDIRRIIWRLYIRFKNAFKPHREIFIDYCRVLNPENDPIAYQFLWKFDFEFGTHIREGEPITEDHYRLVLCYLDKQNPARSGRFQASYTFCRSVWFTIVTFSIIYLIMEFSNVPFFNSFYQEADPIIKQIFKSNLDLVAFSFGLSAIPFIYASSAYMDYFIEYVVADFINS